MRIRIIGERTSSCVIVPLDRYTDGINSMSRTTGYTCTAVANLVINGDYNRTGISPPEYLGEHFNFVKNYLEERGVNYKVNKK